MKRILLKCVMFLVAVIIAFPLLAQNTGSNLNQNKLKNSSTKLASKSTVVFSEDWEDEATWDNWITVDNNSDTKTWAWLSYGGSFSSACAHYVFGSIAGDDWLFSPSIALKADRTYRMSFWHDNIYQVQKLRISVGSSTNPSDHSNILINLPDIEGRDTVSVVFKIPTDGDYHLGFYCYSEALGYSYLYVDDIQVEEYALNGIPARVDNLTPIPGENGVVSMGLSWTNPSTTYGGSALTELTAINIYKDGAATPTVFTTTLGIGATATWTDPNPTEGNHTYIVKAINSLGQSFADTVNTFVGIDVPSEPQNLSLVNNSGVAALSWSAPEGLGVKGGWYNTNNITYRIVRNPGNVVLETSYSGNSYTDNTITSLGIYSYVVTARNSDGVGGFATSNTVKIGSAIVLPFAETWEDPSTLNLWTIINSTNDEGTWARGSSRGYTYPSCMYFYTFNGNYSPEDDWVISPKMRFETGKTYRLTFYAKTHLFSYEDLTVTLGKDATIAAQTTTIYSLTDYTTGFEYDKNVVTFTVSATGSYCIGFNTTTGTNNIYIDDITVEELQATDMKAVSVTGSTAPTVNTETTHIFTVLNNGSASVSAYTVQLLDPDNNVLASKDITRSLASGKTAEVAFVWTPTVVGNFPVRGNVICSSDGTLGNNTSDIFNIAVQEASTNAITVGNGTTLDYVLPFYMYSQLFSESVYLAKDFGNFAGLIESIAYKAQISNESVRDQHIKIWMGETKENSLAAGWIPSTNLSLVFDNFVSFPLGTYDLKIPLDNAFKYTGGNLVILICGLDDRELADGVKFFMSDYTIAASRVNKTMYNLVPENPDNTKGTFYSQIPNTMFFLNSEGMGKISGYVYEADGSTPIAGATVSVGGMAATKTTDAKGYYEFPYIYSGENTLTASIKGYVDGIKSLTISSEESASLNFSLSKLAKVNITGTIVGSNNIKVGLSDASVTLSLYDDLSTTSDADGNFAFSNVYGESKYIITISATGYANYIDTVDVGGVNLSLDTLVVNEVASRPANVAATDRVNNALVTWNNPIEPKWIQKDSRENYGSFGGNAGEAYSVGHRYTPEDFAALGITKGYSITKIRLFPSAIATYKLKVWVGSIESESEIYTETITPTIGDWYEHTLATPVDIDITQNVVIGYEILQTGGALPVGFDSGPCVLWGDVMKTGSTWTTAHQQVSSMNYNWNIHAFCETSSNKQMELKSVAQIKAENLVKDTLNSATEGKFFFKLNSSKSGVLKSSSSKNLPNGFRVWRLLKGEESDESKWELLTNATLTDTFLVDDTWKPLYDTIYRYAVKSEYANGVLSEATFSNMVDKGKYAVVTATITTNAETSEGAIVTLLNSYNEYSGVADASGNVTIENVYFGTYKINITRTGCREFEQEGIVVDENAEDIGIFNIEEDTRPPRNAVAKDYIDNSEISWYGPSSSYSQWIFKDDGINYDGLGYFYGGTMIVAQRFTPTELQSLGVDGYSISKIKIFPYANGVFTLKIWSGIEGHETEIYSESIEPTAGEWYDHKLTTPVQIDLTKSYLIGYEVTHEMGYFPCGYDDGPHLEGGDIIQYTDGKWYSFYELMEGMVDMNWNIHAYCSPESSSSKFVSLAKEISSEKVKSSVTPKVPKNTFMSGLKSKSSKTSSVSKAIDGDAKLTITYKVWRLIEADKGDPSKWKSLTETPIADTLLKDNSWSTLVDTNYVYAIVAKYNNENYSDTVFTNTLEKGKVSTVTLNVTTNNSLSAQGANVTLTCDDGSSDHVYSDTLDQDGKRILYQVYKGVYTIKIEKEGYELLEVSNVTISDNYTTLNYQLTEETTEPLVVTAVDNSSHAQITWFAPGTYVPSSGWIYWDNNEAFSGVGTNDEFVFDVAQRFTSQDLVDLKAKGLSITKVSLFFVSTTDYPSTATFTVKIWKGTETPTLVYSQAVESPAWNEWNDIMLTTPVAIEEGDELWIGYNCDATAGYPAGIDKGPEIAGKGNMICVDNEWHVLTDLSSSLTYNWLIHAYCDAVEGTTESQPVILSTSSKSSISGLDKVSLAPSMERLDIKANHLKVQTESSSAKSNLGYKVWRLLASDESDESKWTLLTETSIADTSYLDYSWSTIGNGDYMYAVKSVYVSGNSAAVLSNVITQTTSGVNEDELDNVNVYPNPSNGNFSISVTQPVTATITDITGKVVFEQQLSNSVNSISLKVSAGIYLIKLETSTQSSYHKIVIQ
ncbi:MAG: carboxypeptidase regulatory-like domain-containing protein [Bacteroidales bacterium]